MGHWWDANSLTGHDSFEEFMTVFTSLIGVLVKKTTRISLSSIDDDDDEEHTYGPGNISHA